MSRRGAEHQADVSPYSQFEIGIRAETAARSFQISDLVQFPEMEIRLRLELVPWRNS